MPLKHRHPVRKKIADDLIREIEANLGCRISYDGIAETADINGIKLLLLGGIASIIFLKDKPFLTLSGISRYKPEKRFVTVDRGAVKFVIGGANIMAPGIIDADESIRKGDIVWVRNEEGTALALGYALMDGIDMVKANKGKAVESLHHIGDELWKLSVELSKS
ncbi:MAG: PUA domain-containing protein [Candidatus Thermoplasmatota archaeon]|nr:PUA domain-containing protein [Candidatus Thermoplasmatota archaeon]